MTSFIEQVRHFNSNKVATWGKDSNCNFFVESEDWGRINVEDMAEALIAIDEALESINTSYEPVNPVYVLARIEKILRGDDDKAS